MNFRKLAAVVACVMATFVTSPIVASSGQTSSAAAVAWNNLRQADFVKTRLDAEQYQYPMIGNAGLVLLADPYGFTKYKPSKASYQPNLLYSAWWKGKTKRATPFAVRGGYAGAREALVPADDRIVSPASRRIARDFDFGVGLDRGWPENPIDAERIYHGGGSSGRGNPRRRARRFQSANCAATGLSDPR